MKKDWIVEVLQDLDDYATLEGFEALSKKIKETIAVCRVELSSPIPFRGWRADD